MREILFRGKRKTDGEWIFGNLLRTDDDGICIIQNHVPRHLLKNYEVDPETVCQYTGLTDKNGRNIFEGDILLHDSVGNVKVQFEKSEFLAVGISHDMFSTLLSSIYKDCEIIGSIFDNPELIGDQP